VAAWLSSPSVVLLAETADYWASLRPVLESSRVVGARVHDARIVALCASHGVRELWSADRDFSAFGGINVRNRL
jgi:hypothetical protein